jgi:hypothetical protein
MCVILDIEPEKAVPDKMMETACDINKHGFGVAYADGGEIKIIRSLDTPNDPDKVQKLLSDLKKHRRYVHLRHATVGKVTMENNHPLVVLHGKRGRVELAMMHNGTLTRFEEKGDDRSDTFFFNQKVVSPLAERVAAFSKPKEVLDDPIFQHVMRCEAGSSLFLFFDAFGKALRVGMWEQYGGFVASNKYSFSSSHHRSSSVRTTWYTPAHQGQGRVIPISQRRGQVLALPWKPVDKPTDVVSTAMKELNEEKRPVVDVKALPSGQVTKALPFPPNRTTTSLLKELMGVRKFLAEHKREVKMTTKNLQVVRTNVLEKLQQPNFDFLRQLTTEDINDLVSRYPAVMSEVVLELVAENLALLSKNETQASTIKDMTEKK